MFPFLCASVIIPVLNCEKNWHVTIFHLNIFPAFFFNIYIPYVCTEFKLIACSLCPSVSKMHLCNINILSTVAAFVYFFGVPVITCHLLRYSLISTDSDVVLFVLVVVRCCR